MEQQIEKMKRPVVMKIDVPFCSRHCSFCHRQVTEGRNSALIHSYILALALELKENAKEFQDCRIEAIRFGGGCASIMSGNDFDQLCRLIRTFYTVSDHAPFSMRVCPADINGANQPFYNRNHITRYDLEIFSLEPDDYIHLDYLNYRDQLPYISKGFLRAAQRNNMGFVLLYGKKTISRWGFRRSVLETIRKDVIHIQLQRCTGVDAMDDAAVQEQLSEAHELLTKANFVEYLPDCWAKPGYEDQYRVKRSQGMDVIGFGLGAETLFDNVRSTNTKNLELYLKHSDDYRKITENVQPR